MPAASTDNRFRPRIPARMASEIGEIALRRGLAPTEVLRMALMFGLLNLQGIQTIPAPQPPARGSAAS